MVPGEVLPRLTSDQLDGGRSACSRRSSTWVYKHSSWRCGSMVVVPHVPREVLPGSISIVPGEVLPGLTSDQLDGGRSACSRGSSTRVNKHSSQGSSTRVNKHSSHGSYTRVRDTRLPALLQ